MDKKAFGHTNHAVTRPEFEIYIDLGNDEYIKQQKCTALGERPRFPGENSALVALEKHDIVVKLPSHRVFVLLGPNGPEQVEGMVNLPLVCSVGQLQSSYMALGAIMELDSKFITKDDYFRYPSDINHKLVQPGSSYLFVGQVVLWRGQDVTTVSYAEVEPEYRGDIRTWPNLLKNSNLPPSYASLEQAHLQIVQASPEKQPYAGTRVLEYAAGIHYGNRHLVANWPIRVPR